MSIFNFYDRLRRIPIGLLPTDLNGISNLDAARSGACGRAVR
jgi:hypothetical protein